MYEKYLRAECALAQATIFNYALFVRSFLKDCFGSGSMTLSRIHPRDVIRFVQRQARRLHLKRAKLMTTALSSFLRYARCRGEVRLDLASAVPCVANWSIPSIPRGIAPEQMRRLLSQIDRFGAV